MRRVVEVRYQELSTTSSKNNAERNTFGIICQRVTRRHSENIRDDGHVTGDRKL